MTKKIDEVVPAPTWVVGIDSKGNIEKLELMGNMMQDAIDAERWRKLKRLIGDPQNGSAVKLFWDIDIPARLDRPPVPFIIASEVLHWNTEIDNFNDLIDSIPEPKA